MACNAGHRSCTIPLDGAHKSCISFNLSNDIFRYRERKRIESTRPIGVWLHEGSSYLSVLYQAPPALEQQQQRDTRTVTIPRRIAENALVSMYKKALRGMSDEEISRLFEEEIVVTRANADLGDIGMENAMRDFPTEDILESSIEIQKQEDVGSESTSTRAPGTSYKVDDTDIQDETAQLLQNTGEKGPDMDQNDGQSQNYFEVIFNTIMKDRLVAGKDPKELAVPIMGTGALVLGVALMYKLISTISVGDTQESTMPSSSLSKDGMETPKRLEDTFDRENDPYTLYNTAAGTGGVIWERKEENDEFVAPLNNVERNTIDEDPWRIPMNNGKQESSKEVSGESPSPTKQEHQEHKRSQVNLEQILDNAESISRISGLKGKRIQSTPSKYAGNMNGQSRQR